MGGREARAVRIRPARSRRRPAGDRYDSDPSFAEKRNKKHGDRAGYETHLKQQAKGKLEGATGLSTWPAHPAGAAHANKAKDGGDGVPEQLQKEVSPGLRGQL